MQYLLQQLHIMNLNHHMNCPQHIQHASFHKLNIQKVISIPFSRHQVLFGTSYFAKMQNCITVDTSEKQACDTQQAPVMIQFW